MAVEVPFRRREGLGGRHAQLTARQLPGRVDAVHTRKAQQQAITVRPSSRQHQVPVGFAARPSKRETRRKALRKIGEDLGRDFPR